MYQRSSAEKAAGWVAAADAWERIGESVTDASMRKYWVDQAWFARKMAGLLEA